MAWIRARLIACGQGLVVGILSYAGGIPLLVLSILSVAFIPLFVGLAVVLPLLGHSTWHLYRRAVEPDPNPRQDYRPQQKGLRYAADFPAVLFPWFRHDR